MREFVISGLVASVLLCSPVGARNVDRALNLNHEIYPAYNLQTSHNVPSKTDYVSTFNRKFPALPDSQNASISLNASEPNYVRFPFVEQETSSIRPLAYYGLVLPR